MISLPQSVVLRNTLEAMNREHIKTNLQAGQSLLRPQATLRCISHACSKNMLSPLNVTARTKQAMNSSTLSIKAYVGEKKFKLISPAIFNDDSDMKYAELTRISDSWAAEETDTILLEGRINLKKRSCATKKIYHQMCKNLVQEKFKGVEEVVKLRRNIM